MKHKKFNDIFEENFINIGILEAISRQTEADAKATAEAKKEESKK